MNRVQSFSPHQRTEIVNGVEKKVFVRTDGHLSGKEHKGNEIREARMDWVLGPSSFQTGAVS